MNGKRCIIVGAAQINNYQQIKKYFNNDDFYIFCDGGLNHVDSLGVIPNLIIGDFDSHVRPEADIVNGNKIEVIQLPHEKDWTDTYFAAMEAVKRGFEDIILIGVIGQRFDHSLVNISVLLYLKEQNKNALIIDDYSEMLLVEKDPVFIDDTFSYFSLLCVAGDVSGVTIKNAKYPLEKGDIKTNFQYASSNEVLKTKQASVSVENGCLLLIKVF